jgi:hypothetical protein
VSESEFVGWVTPRPAYMREIEPLAVPGAWDSPFCPGKYQPVPKIQAQSVSAVAPKAMKAMAKGA